MAKVNVAQFATELKLSADKLVEQLKAAGVKKALTDKTALTEGDKTSLLE
jgi:translation initiation factor IF-2